MADRLAVFAHPLVGQHRGRSLIGCGYVVAVLALVLVSGWRRTLFRSGGQLPTLVDGLSWLVIILAMLPLAGALIYPVVNGGPGLTVAIALSPHLGAAIARRSVAGDVDGRSPSQSRDSAARLLCGETSSGLERFAIPSFIPGSWMGPLWPQFRCFWPG